MATATKPRRTVNGANDDGRYRVVSLRTGLPLLETDRLECAITHAEVRGGCRVDWRPDGGEWSEVACTE
jgi:hypothetical protein